MRACGTYRHLARRAGGVCLGIAALALTAQAAFAQNVAAVEWEQRYDSAPAAARMPKSSVPILSKQTLEMSQYALEEYTRIEQMGGWPMMPDGPILKLGTRDAQVQILRQRLIVSGDLPANLGNSDVFDSYVDAAVKRFQARHGLIVNGAVGPDSRKAMNVPASIRRHQIEVSMQRLATLTKKLDRRFVIVNIPGQEVEAVSDGVVELRHTAVVGKPDRQSPQLTVKIQEVNFNPYW